MKDGTRTEIDLKADLILAEIRATTGRLAAVTGALEREMAGLQEAYGGQVQDLEAELAEQAGRLEKFQKKHRLELFGEPPAAGTDAARDLPNGRLIWAAAEKVKRVKKMLDRLKAAGFADGIKIEEAVNWPKLETWPEERLAEVGTARVRVETFSYDLAQGGKDG